MTRKTDGHWPLARLLGDRTAIACECGRGPKRVATGKDMLSAWHQTHRRGLFLAPVAYEWPEAMEGLSAGGYVQAAS